MRNNPVRYHKLDLNLLTALKALLAEKNVTRAGEAVHVTQSAMSGILARLRDYFGDPLIVQVGRKMELTSLAESLVEPVNDVLLRIDATNATRPELNPLSSQALLRGRLGLLHQRAAPRCTAPHSPGRSRHVAGIPHPERERGGRTRGGRGRFHRQSRKPALSRPVPHGIVRRLIRHRGRCRQYGSRGVHFDGAISGAAPRGLQERQVRSTAIRNLDGEPARR